MILMFLLVLFDKFLICSRVCIVVGCELKKIVDDFEVSFEVVRWEKFDKRELNVVVIVIKIVCVFVGLVFIGWVVWKIVINWSEFVFWGDR